MKGAPSHDDTWQPSQDLIDKDKTVADVWQRYISGQEILPQYHGNIDEDVNEGEKQLCSDDH